MLPHRISEHAICRLQSSTLVIKKSPPSFQAQKHRIKTPDLQDRIRLHYNSEGVYGEFRANLAVQITAL